MPEFHYDLSYSYFPPPDEADEHGLLAYGGNLHPNLILNAYVHGIFPWYSGDTPLWWNPDPRFILYPEELKVAKSMRPYFNQKKFTITYNHNFSEVIHQCMSVKRTGQNGTWLNDEMIEAYTQLHQDGYVHSVEVMDKEGQLVGGLYGLAIGKIFFGESMFSTASNASKFGFISLVQLLKKKNFLLIDCQQETRHLSSMGARNIPRNEFLALLTRGILTGELLQLPKET